MTTSLKEKIRCLMDKGVHLPVPENVFIDDAVDPNRISGQGVILWPGSRISGRDTLILSGVQIGCQGPATVENCWLGPDTQIASGYCSGAVLLGGARLGADAHVRAGTILEEGAATAHCVGLKQTVLFPFVTLGSLINFCDIFMAGGTGAKNHSEVGSSYIHFNFTPNQDKATASLLGDVPRGVMLNQNPLFLGGQGGLVGPSRLAFGTVIAAGSICRKDHLKPDRLVCEGGGRSFSMPHIPGGFGNIRRIVVNNLTYIANLVALDRWYAHVRSGFIHDDLFPAALLQGLRQTLAAGIAERIRQLDNFIGKLAKSDEMLKNMDPDAAAPVRTRALVEARKALWKALSDWDDRDGETVLRDRFLAGLQASEAGKEADYVAAITALSPDLKIVGTRWLQSVVDDVLKNTLEELPAFQPSR